MDESASHETSLLDFPDESNPNNSNDSANNGNHGWMKVVYPKRQRKILKSSDPSSNQDRLRVNGTSVSEKENVFRSIDQQFEDRRHRVLEAQKAATAAAAAEYAATRSKHRVVGSDDEDENDEDKDVSNHNHENGTDVKKIKQKKSKRPKITVLDAASKINSSDLQAHLIDIDASYASQQDILLMRFADYFAQSFSSVSASQFPWPKIFKESPISKIVDIPLNSIPDDVYKISIDWIGRRSSDALHTFVLWTLESIIADINQLGPTKTSKKSANQISSKKSQVAIFVVLAMVLRRKPDVLISLIPTLRDNQKYQGLDKLPLIIWVITQACQGDPVVAIYAWIQLLFPLVTGKSGSNPQIRDLVLQAVERILSTPKARTILINGAVRKGERLVSPSSLDLLMRVTFPASSARVKATQRFEAIYPILKEVALAGSTGTKAMKQVSQQLLPLTIEAMMEGNSELNNEAADVFIWCLSKNTECYKQWEKLHPTNIKASLIVLQKLCSEWKKHSNILFPFDTLRETIINLKKNEQVLGSGVDGDSQVFIKEVDKCCKFLLGKSARGFSCIKSSLFVLVLAIVAGAVFVSPNMQSWDWNKIYLMLGSTQSSHR